MKFQKMRSSVAEHRPHKAARTGSSPVASTSFSVCSSAWSEHCVWDAGARSSNLFTPTNFAEWRSLAVLASLISSKSLVRIQPLLPTFAWIAQSVERRPEKPCVGGSTPSPCTTTVNLLNHFNFSKFNEATTKIPGYTKSLRRLGHEASGRIASQTQQSDSSSREGKTLWGCSSRAEHSAFNRQKRG